MMNNVFSDILKRTVKTMCQCALGYVAVGATISQIDWCAMLSAVAVAGLSCVLMNVYMLLGGDDE